MFFLKDLPTKEMLASYKKEFPEMRPEAVEAALIFMRQASLLLRDLEKYFAQHGLSQTRFLILILLDREANQEGLMAMDLVAKMDVSKTVISKTNSISDCMFTSKINEITPLQPRRLPVSASF